MSSRDDSELRRAQSSNRTQAIVTLAVVFALFFVMWTIIEADYGPITPRAIGRGFLLALPIPAAVGLFAAYSWRSKSKSNAQLLESFGLDADKADLGDPTWFATRDYPPVLLHESMFARNRVVKYHKETIDPGANDHALSEECYEVSWVDSHGKERTVTLPSDYALSADPEALDRFGEFCKRWDIKLRQSKG